MTTPLPDAPQARVVPLRPVPSHPAPLRPVPGPQAEPEAREPLLRDVVGGVLRRERLTQGRTLKDVAEAARISVPYLSELERGRKEASSEVLAAAARALGLGLGDVLSLVQEELVEAHRRRATAARRASATAGRSATALRTASAAATASAGRYGGLCLAA
ncbi:MULTISPECIES: helix-turn-helix transcriptional regulator [Kitasatospora]|uniref:Putative transcriptional regulator n=1 Tax=Kitasatospora setae (strain ATCC 33774 / DSM 43861 / JCM 3304 / KCC A-0304 / NBRC 14216 / KM-6054) TaxID=452652 RepID=E4N3I0_KITSK|nr:MULTISPECIES: helix-turn-helix transcriptional regulator [Kitasatospora]BAJ32714.1 putative transcriptional regulator [Kitasatospora setae KM-6054]